MLPPYLAPFACNPIQPYLSAYLLVYSDLLVYTVQSNPVFLLVRMTAYLINSVYPNCQLSIQFCSVLLVSLSSPTRPRLSASLFSYLPVQSNLTRLIV